jgi:hypothetical protein
VRDVNVRAVYLGVEMEVVLQKMKERRESLESFRKRMIVSRLSPATRAQYAIVARRVLCEQGDLGYRALLGYIQQHYHLATGTLRGVKSAVLMVMSLKGREFMMAPRDSEDLDRVLDGHEVSRSQEHRRKPRGAITRDKLMILVKEAKKRGLEGIADAMRVASGCALRQQDLESLTAASVSLEEFYVRVPRKDRILNKVRKGHHDEREIMTRDALRILKRRMMKHPEGALFPNYSRSRINEFIQEIATREGWDPTLMWDGLHCHRHGAAADLKLELLAKLQVAGSWKSPTQAAHYARRVRD